MTLMQPEFPISVRFENGEIESYDDLDELLHKPLQQVPSAV
jgi:hypothetical protein